MIWPSLLSLVLSLYALRCAREGERALDRYEELLRASAELQLADKPAFEVGETIEIRPGPSGSGVAHYDVESIEEPAPGGLWRVRVRRGVNGPRER